VGIQEIKEIIFAWDVLLNAKEKKYIHYRSMRNFVLHFSDISNQILQNKILVVLNEYVDEIRGATFVIESDSSYFFAKKYLRPLSEYYHDNAQFVRIFQINAVITYGLMLDILLYLSRLFSKIEPIPLVTLGFFFYYLFVKIFKERKGRVYGYYY